MDYCQNGSLMDYIIRTKGQIQQKEVFTIFSQILDGLYFLHNNNIIHGDLK